MADGETGYVGWVDGEGSRIIVPAASMKCIIKREDGTFFVSCRDNIKDQDVKELNVFKSLEDAYVWMTH